MVCGQSRTGKISLLAEWAAYTFTGISGTVVVVSASASPGAASVVAEVFDPSGARVGETPGNGRITLTLQQSGTYTALVRSSNPIFASGGYGISLQFTQGQCGTAIACGQSLAGERKL